MNEYVYAALSKERNRYDHFRRATGRDYDYLLEIHKTAVEILDSDRSGLLPSVSEGYMAVSPRLLAYLTDIALQHLALGYESPRPHEGRESNAEGCM